MQKGYIFITLILLGCVSANFYQISKEFTHQQFDARALSTWKLDGFDSSATSNCAGQSIVGGPNVVATGSMTKTFTTKFDLQNVQIIFDLYLFDQWLSGWEGGRSQDTIFKVLVNDQQVYQIGSDYTRQIHAKSSNICGGSTPDRATHVSFNVPVSGKSFKVQLIAQIQSNNPGVASWGIRDFYILTNYGATSSQLVLSELSNDTNFDVSQWTSSFNNAVTSCPNKILGGYNAAANGAWASRKITNLPSHSFLIIDINSFFVDSIDSNDTILFYVDGRIVHEETRQYFISSKNVCGASWNDNPNSRNIIYVPHFASTAEFKIVINTDQPANDESFGFRDFKVSVDTPCPVIYEQPKYQGKALSFCGDIPNLTKIGWTNPIKSVYIPQGYAIRVYEDSYYDGKKFKLSKSRANLTGKEYKFVNKAFNIETSDDKLERNE